MLVACRMRIEYAEWFSSSMFQFCTTLFSHCNSAVVIQIYSSLIDHPANNQATGVCKPAYLVPVPSQDKVGGLRQEGHPA